MIIDIHQRTRLSEIQEQFKKEYPFLKLEFYDQPHSWGESSENAHCYDKCFPIYAITKSFASHCQIEIKPWHKAGELEEHFERALGLHAQVFRTHGFDWIQTAGTDDLTLFEQNEIGKESRIAEYRNLWIEREVIY